MNVWQRAWASVTRRKGKSLILLVVIFILGNVMAGAITVDQSVAQTETRIKNKLSAEATFELDYPTLWAASKKDASVFDELEAVSLETIEKIAESPYVSHYDYNQMMYLSSEKWQEYDPEARKKTEEEMSLPISLFLKGVHYGPLLDLEQKRIELVAGRTLSAEDVNGGKKVAVISKEVADANGLQVGDKMELDNAYYEHSESGERHSEPSFIQTLGIEIVGLFSPVAVERKQPAQKTDLDYSRDYQNYRQFNTIYLPNQVVSALNLESFQKMADLMPEPLTEAEIKRESEMYSPMYVLKSPELAVSFKADTQPLLPKYYQVLTANDQYEAVAGSLTSLQKMANSILVVATGATLLILTLVMLLFLRDRRHEMGIYVSFGEDRWKIVSQFVLEVLLVAILGISLSVISGNLLAKGFSGTLVAINTPEITNAMEPGIPEFVITPNLSEGDVASAYTTKLTTKSIGLFYVVGLGTVVLATLLPSLYVLRLNPKKILM